MQRLRGLHVRLADAEGSAVRGVCEERGRALRLDAGAETHADDQAIGQSYLALYKLDKDPKQIAALKAEFDDVMTQPDNPKKPVWWWCDALFMAPPVWAVLSETTGDAKYDAYMDHEWKVTDDLLWDKGEHLFSRDATYFEKREKNGAKIFWSRGNGWVMGGLVRVLQVLPKSDPSYGLLRRG